MTPIDTVIVAYRSEDVIEDMRAQLDPPAGVSAELAALPPVLANTSAGLRTSWLG